MTQTNSKKTFHCRFIETIGSLLILLLYCLLSNLWVFAEPFWRYDDPMLLQQLINSSFTRILFSSEFELWQTFGRFLPLPGFFLMLGYKLAGLNVSFFYYTHLIIIYLISCATFVWLRSFTGNINALLAGLLFLAGSTTSIISNQIMNCPYSLGLFFAVIFLIFCQKIEISFFHRYLGAIFLFFAMMTQEPYVVFLLYPLIKQSKLPYARRLSSMMPAIIFLIIFFVWRTIILKGIGGYGSPTEEGWNNLLTFFSSIGKVFFGDGWLAVCAAGSITFVFIFTLFIYMNRPILKPVLKITVGVCAVIITFLPALVANKHSPQQVFSGFVYHRYLFLSWWAFSCLLMALPKIISSDDQNGFQGYTGINRWKKGILIFFTLFTIMLLTIQNQNNQWLIASTSSFDNLYRYAIGKGAGSTLYFPDRDSFWYYDLQLKSLADIYMRPRLHLEYKNVGQNREKGDEYSNWIFNPSCSCFIESKKR